VARADDILHLQTGPGAVVTCRFNGEQRDCSRFQGYVIVRRRSDASAVATSAQNEPQFGAERVYLPVESQSEH
jgi:hypothetical protein